ncbi:hypothetical protein QM012_005548 [Aureobasidium pullulans]|uniref:XPG N-terminal domain-containing protein n=1 Tax=Aureobasidium pullulans TaxID=5580 RepID=A0ABR0T4P9_AURPU
MGIPGLWDILGEGEVKSLAQLSTDHFQKHKRPLRVAIDEAGWRFHNLSDDQVRAIRQKLPGANPIEKAILWRVLKLMRLNIQPIFIFDGPSRPWKRGGVAGRIDWKKIDLLRKTLNMLKIPHHRAPAEAEAELLIKEHREGKGITAKKSDNLVRIYCADAIEQKHGIDRQGLILFALLSGGDYDTKGLPGCGPMAALGAARFDNGRLGKMLCETPLRQLHCFTESLREYFQMSSSRSVYVPPGYPRELHVKNYREPKVSTPEQAHDLRGLKNGWYVPIDEAKLRPFLFERFNFNTKDYLKHILPILLTKELVQTNAETIDKNLGFELQLVQKRGRDYDADCLERQITFDPKKCTKLNLWSKPGHEDWPESFDPTPLVEAELPEYILVNALGEAEMQRLKLLASQPKPRKRKNVDAGTELGSQTSAQPSNGAAKPAAKKHRKSITGEVDPSFQASTQELASKPAAKPKLNKKHGKTITSNKEAETNEPEAPTPPVKKSFQLPRALVRNPSMLSEITSQSSQDVLSRSASVQSSDSMADTPQMVSDKPISHCASKEASAERSYVPSLDNQISIRRQLDRDGFSWLSPQSQPIRVLEDNISSMLEPMPVLSASTALLFVQPATSQEPSSSRGQVIIDLWSDDEDTTPAPISSSAPLLSSAPVAHAPMSCAPTYSASDSRQAIAVARLKHFEKKAPETIDLTLDD